MRGSPFPVDIWISFALLHSDHTLSRQWLWYHARLLFSQCTSDHCWLLVQCLYLRNNSELLFMGILFCRIAPVIVESRCFPDPFTHYRVEDCYYCSPKIGILFALIALRGFVWWKDKDSVPATLVLLVSKSHWYSLDTQDGLSDRPGIRRFIIWSYSVGTSFISGCQLFNSWIFSTVDRQSLRFWIWAPISFLYDDDVSGACCTVSPVMRWPLLFGRPSNTAGCIAVHIFTCTLVHRF